MPMPELEEKNSKWEVEKVRDESRIRGKKYYLVKWAGWPSEYNTWEPEKHLANAPLKVKAFYKGRKQGRNVRELFDVEGQDADS